MSVSVKLQGGVQLSHLGFRLRQAGAKDIEKEMRRELVKLAAPLGRQVKAGIPSYMPVSGGYAGVLAGAFRTRTKVGRGAGASLTVEGYARGEKTYRAVERLNAGVLRKPVFGRTRRTRLKGYTLNPWVSQKVRARFWSDHADRMAQPAAEAAVKVLDGIAAKIAGE